MYKFFNRDTKAINYHVERSTLTSVAELLKYRTALANPKFKQFKFLVDKYPSKYKMKIVGHEISDSRIAYHFSLHRIAFIPNWLDRLIGIGSVWATVEHFEVIV